MRVRRTRWYTDGALDFVTDVTPEIVTGEATLEHNLPDGKPESFAGSIAIAAKPAEASLGDLEILPTEVLEMILVRTDLWTLLRLRQTNRRALQALGALPQFRAVAEHAPSALHGAVAIRTASQITCQRLYDALCTPNCEACGDLAAYLFMLHAGRVCWRCLNEDRRYGLLPARDAQFLLLTGEEEPGSRKTGEDALGHLPHMLPRPGRYTVAGLQRAFPATMTWDCLDAARSEPRWSHTAPLQIGTRDGPGLSEDKRMLGCADFVDKEWFEQFSLQFLAFTAVVRVPWLDRATKLVDWGGHCKGCEFRHGSMHGQVPVCNGRRKYTRQAFEEHVKEAGPIVNGRHVRELPSADSEEGGEA